MCERYNLTTDKWQMIAPMNIQRCTSNSTVYKGKVYVFGGYNGVGRVREIERYNDLTDQWEFVQLSLKLHVEASILVMLSEHEVLILGGKDHYSQTAFSILYNFESGTTENFQKMFCGHVLAKGGKFCNRLISFGGSTNNIFEYMDLEEMEWRKYPTLEFVEDKTFAKMGYAQSF